MNRGRRLWPGCPRCGMSLGGGEHRCAKAGPRKVLSNSLRRGVTRTAQNVEWLAARRGVRDGIKQQSRLQRFIAGVLRRLG